MLKKFNTATPSPHACSHDIAALPLGVTMRLNDLSHQRFCASPCSIKRERCHPTHAHARTHAMSSQTTHTHIHTHTVTDPRMPAHRSWVCCVPVLTRTLQSPHPPVQPCTHHTHHTHHVTTQWEREVWYLFRGDFSSSARCLAQSSRSIVVNTPTASEPFTFNGAASIPRNCASITSGAYGLHACTHTHKHNNNKHVTHCHTESYRIEPELFVEDVDLVYVRATEHCNVTCGRVDLCEYVT